MAKARLVRGCTGAQLREMFSLALVSLERQAPAIDALNVFPVPDGDTGTNMLLTVRAMMAEAQKAPDSSAAAVAQSMARGALLGARGNSGVILSQFFHGLAKALAGKTAVSGADFALALQEGSQAAYRGVSRPVEGTMLTVMREAGVAACSRSGEPLLAVLETATEGARKALALTPELLPVLRQAGVVDAGGQGFLVLLEGTVYCLKGEELPPAPDAQALARPRLEALEERDYGYCTEFLLEGTGLRVQDLRQKVESLGESVLVVGDEGAVKVHVHTFDPGAVLSYASGQGALHQVKVQNMDEQHQALLAKPQETLALAVVAVASGEGFAEVFRGLGARVVIPGGQTMNPSVQELLAAIEQASAEHVILLPNNENIVPASRQAQTLSAGRLMIVPTVTLPQGVAALLAFDLEKGPEENLAAMERARLGVRTAEFTRAVREATVGRLKIKLGRVMGFVDGKLVKTGSSLVRVITGTVKKMGPGELLTLYCGAETSPQEVQRVLKALNRAFPELEVEVVQGRQPHYPFILSLE